jgi:molecular chaperone GrpE
MSDAAPSMQSSEPAGDAAPAGALNPDAIERILGDFRAWLYELTVFPNLAPAPPAVDLNTLVGQFTALRHEVNLQTKAARSAVEQSGEALTRLGEAVDHFDESAIQDEALKPLLKAVVDVYDNLAIALRQAVRQREAIEKPLADVADGIVIPEPPEAIDPGLPLRPPGFWKRLFGVGLPLPADFAVAVGRQTMSDWRETELKECEGRQERVADAANLVRSSLDGLIAGYQMSLARVDRVLTQFELEPIATEGETFDPELMEAVETVGDTDVSAGEVVEEVRRGYLWREVVFRFAQVKVAR